MSRLLVDYLFSICLLIVTAQICPYDLYYPDIEPIDFDGKATEQLSGPVDGLADTVPEVLSQDQKGLGLSSLKESLISFSNPRSLSLPEDFNGTDEEKQELLNTLRQQSLEADTIKSTSKRWRAEFGDQLKFSGDLTLGKGRIKQLASQWHTDLVAKIEEELEIADAQEAEPVLSRAQKDRHEYAVYLRSLDSDTLAAVTILSVMSTFSKGGMDTGIKVSAVASTIGRDVRDELIARACLSKTAGSGFGRSRRLRDMLAKRRRKDHMFQWKAMMDKMSLEEPELAWSPRVIMRIGAVLTKLLVDVGKVPVRTTDPASDKVTTSMHPALQHSYQISFGKRQGLLHLHPEIVQTVAREPPAELLGRQLPMVCKPRPWKGIHDGGYMVYKTNIVRTTPGETLQPAYIRAALENDGLADIRRGLDVLGRTGWAINRDVFDVMLEAWNSGDAIGSLSPLNPDLPTPPKPDPGAGYEVQKKWESEMLEIKNQISGFHSQRCFQNFQLEVARSFRNDTFYLPHNMDFRGRAYPLPPYLNQMGADTSRGLLLFSKAKPLGENGMRWLKIQIANLAGFDKASMSEREQFTMDNLSNILDSADNGLHGNRWWLKAEDPWQCLAACCELRNALRHPNPIEYPSRLPIHQDGSCNGLQHYAALGGDSVGAQQVNLEPSDRPSDVYTGVSEYVKKAMAKEAAEGVEYAKIFENRITRKVVKQTVMTNVYGVTYMGAMKQVRKQLYDHYPELDSEVKRKGAAYIARKIFEALGSMFNGAHDIQYWLGDCASRINMSLSRRQIEEITSEALTFADATEANKKLKLVDPAKYFRSTVIWTTPLGLPVVQPYRTRKTRRVSTTLQDLNVIEGSSEDVVSRRKQLQAFPPNFIHSLDATHMMMSANTCDEAGLTFSAVHDSFWTHACDVDKMNDILRDAFVQMHSDDIIGRLAAEFDARFGEHLFLAKVNYHSDIGRAIRKYRTKSKNNKVLELADELRRQDLLRSDDPALQAEGRAMETPASIFEKMGGSDADFVVTNSLGETIVGHIPEDLALAERKASSAVDTSDPAIQCLFSDIELTESKVPSFINESEFDAAAEDDVGQAEALSENGKPKRPKRSLPTWLWMPLRFRAVPNKGSWDLARIRDSKYFFS